MTEGVWEFDPDWQYFVRDIGDGSQQIVTRESVEAAVAWAGMTLEQLARAVTTPRPGSYRGGRPPRAEGET